VSCWGWRPASTGGSGEPELHDRTGVT
jgi:hypothetical protein